MRVIDKVRYTEFEVQAALHGVKLKPRMDALDIDKDERKSYDDTADKMLARMKREHTIGAIKNGGRK